MTMARRLSRLKPDGDPASANTGSQDLMVAVGKLMKTRGLNGEIFCHPLTDFLERFADLKVVMLEFSDGRRIDARVEFAREYSNKLAIKFAGLNTPQAVEPYRGALLLVSRDETFELPDDTFYVFELVGMMVETTAGEAIGTVKDVLTIPGNDVYVVDTGKEELLLPAARDLLTIDRDAKKIFVEDLEGLLGK